MNQTNLTALLDLLEGRVEADPKELAADEHKRYALYSDALAAVGQGREVAALALVAQETDEVMRESVLIEHVDRAGEALRSLEAFRRWYDTVRGVIGSHKLAEKRAEDWARLKELRESETISDDELAAASEWLQRRLSEQSTSAPILARLAEHGRTKRIRRAAATRLRNELA